MSLDPTPLRLLPIVLSTIACSALGGLWFTVLFGNRYAEALGRPYDPAEKPGPLFIVGPLVCSFLTVVANSLFLDIARPESNGEAFLFANLVGFGYLVPTLTNTAINPNFPHPFRYVAISAPYFFLANLATTFILFAMR